MAGMAIAMLTLLFGAIYSLSHLTSTPWTRPLAAPTIEAEAPHQIPKFSFRDESGKIVDPARLEGHWTLLTFWSYGCAPCMLELPGLNTFLLNWQGPQFDVLTVNTDEERSDNLESARSFLLEQQITLPTIFDTQGTVRKAFDVTEYPRHFMIDPEGQIVWAASGAFNWNDASTKDQILKLMERDSPATRPDPAE
jgi:peroxiredoxin